MNILRGTVFACFCLLSAQAQNPETKPQLSFKAQADYLALHITGTASGRATSLEYRLAEKGNVEAMAWVPLVAPLDEQGSFTVELPLSSSHWSELQIRSLHGKEVLTQKSTRRQPQVLEWLTSERIAALPGKEREAWTTYLAKSEEARALDWETLAKECRELGKGTSTPAAGNRAEFELDSDTPPDWFAQEATGLLASAILSYQTPAGGWSKAVDYTKGKRSPGTHWTTQSGDGWHYCGTIDNRSTTEQIKLLAGVYTATKREDTKTGVQRGLEYLFTAQFPNGGWPQNYPIESGYHEALTLNDNAMTHVLELLLNVAQGKAPFEFIEAPVRDRAQAAFDKGLACLFAAQVRVEGKPTVWCAQHDPLTLAPVGARKKEPPSLSGAESTELLKFLMRKGPITPAVRDCVEPAIAWLEAHRITGLRKTKNAAGKTDYVQDAASTEAYWARFYDVQTGKPMFAGADDGVVYATFSEMIAKNHVGYDYFTTKPADVIGKEVARWKKRMDKEK